MKRRWILVCPMVFVMAITFNTTAYSGNGSGSRSVSGQTYYADLDETEKATLQFMREEEKLARDVYFKMFTDWEATIFDTISASEQRHMDAIKLLLDKYGLSDPAEGLDMGVFSNDELQNFYDELIIDGSTSLTYALKAGALIEEVDIADLEDALEETDNANLERVYGNLLSGSKNHLRAFVRELTSLNGETYVSQHLSQEEVDEILAGSNESGLRKGKRGN